MNKADSSLVIRSLDYERRTVREFVLSLLLTDRTRNVFGLFMDAILMVFESLSGVVNFVANETDVAVAKFLRAVNVAQVRDAIVHGNERGETAETTNHF